MAGTKAATTVDCPACEGHGRVPAGRFAPVADYECDRCQGAGKLPAAELELIDP